jgi:hypothetical protein
MSQSYFLALTSDFNRSKALFSKGFTIIQQVPISWSIAVLIHKRYIPDPEQLNQQRFKCAAQMRETLYIT